MRQEFGKILPQIQKKFNISFLTIYVPTAYTLFFKKKPVPLNFGLKIAVPSLFDNFSLICSKNFRALLLFTPIANMFVKLLPVFPMLLICLGKCFVCCFYSIVKFQKPKKFYLFAKCAAALCNISIAMILLVNARKLLKFLCFESMLILVSFLMQKFFFFGCS